MRTNKQAKRNALKRIAGLMILVMCFALTFTLVLTLGVNRDLNLDDPTLAPVADAATIIDSSNGKTWGKANPITANANISGSSFMTDASATSWTYTSNLDSVAPTGTTEPTNIALWKDGGDNGCIAITGVANSWMVGIDSVKVGRKFGFSMAYEAPTLIAAMIKNDNFTVTATWSFQFNGRYGGDDWGNIDGTVYYNSVACSPTTVPSAQSYYDNRSSGKSRGDSNKSGLADNLTCASVSLSGDNTCVGFGMAFTCGAGNPFSDGTIRALLFKNIRVKYEITLNDTTTSTAKTSIEDFSAPVKVSETLNGKDTSAYENYVPYVTDVTNMPVYFEEIGTRLASYTDQKNSATRRTLRSFTSQERTATIGSGNTAITYFKSSSIEYADTFDYSMTGFSADKVSSTSNYLGYAGVGGYTTTNSGSSWSTDTNRSLKMVSGIKSVTITVGSGDTAFTTTITVNSLANGGKSVAVALKASSSSGAATIGYAVATKTNKARVKVDIYVSQDATVSTVVTDNGRVNGGRSSTPNVTVFQGIDRSTPSTTFSMTYAPSMEGANSYVATTYSSLTNASWFRDNVLNPTISITKSTTDTGAPLIWFYTVQRSDTASGLSSLPEIEGYGNWRYSSSKDFSTGSHTLIKTLGMKPIAYDSLTSFQYDFVQGAAKALGDSANTFTAKNPTSLFKDDVTGAGYYRFNFYSVDIAGNLGSIVSRYFKVDYDTPDYDIDFSYIVRNADGATTYTISPADNGKWAVGDSTFKITFDKLNFSGNTLIINGKNELTYSIAFNKNGLVNINGTAVAADTLSGSFKVESRIDDTTLSLTYSVEEWTDTKNRKQYRGILTFKFDEGVTGTFPTVAIESPFNTYPGEFASNAVASANTDAAKLVFTNSSWNGGVKLYIDRNAPTAATLSGGEYLINGVNQYSANIADRKWMTNGYSLETSLDFYDDLWNVDSDYAVGIEIYMGFRFIRSQADLDALKALSIETNYRNITQANSRDYFTRFTNTGVTTLEKTNTKFPIDFVANNGSGMRVIYVWAVDQAGNVSPLSAYYILIDNNNYNLSANILNNPIIGQKGTISIADSNGNEIGSAQRGTSININFTLDVGYVPFTLTKNGVRIYENYSPNKSLTKVDVAAFNDLLSAQTPQEGNAYTVTFVFDDFENLGALDASTSFELAVREVVIRNFTSANLQKAYDAQPIDMLKYILFNDDEAAPFYHFDFSVQSEDATILDSAPINIGTYNVRVYLDKENDTFVDSTYAQDKDGNQIKSPVGFTIRTGRVVITITSTSSIYGENIALKYTTSGFDFDENNPAPTGEYLRGSLTLSQNGTKLNASSLNGLINVGSYDIVEDIAFVICDRDGNPSANYSAIEIQDTNPKHTISQRNINIMAWEEHQPYANATQTPIRFGVNMTGSLYEWYTQKGASFTVERLLGTVFEGYQDNGTSEFNGAVYKLFNSNGNITRSAGSRVGEYAYVMPTQFEVDNNYYVTVDVTSRKFFIDKRTVVLDTSANSTQIFETETFDPASVVPTYALAVVDRNLGIDSEVANAVRGLLSLGEGSSQGPTDDYVNVFTYAIILGLAEDNNTIETANLIIKLSDGAVYIVNVAGGDTVLVNVNDGAIFAVIFGQAWTENLITYQLYKDNFTVTGIEADAFDDISWTFAIENASFGDILGAGSHAVTFSDVKLLKNGAEVNARVMVGKVTLNVSPAEVIVRPVADTYTKVYGEPDSVFNIRYEIVSVNGVPFDRMSTYAGYTYQRIESVISGAFARGWYNQNNQFMYNGTTYDNATDSNGFVLEFNRTNDSVTVGTNHYGFTESISFSISDESFSVKADIDLNQRFIIEQRSINLDVSNFVGINKSYDGGTVVNYGNGTPYDISAQLANAQDDLKLSYHAEYTEAGSTEEVRNVGIIFTNLGLTGQAVCNYKLGTITNGDRRNELFDNDNSVVSANISDKIKVVIYYIDNINISDNNKIHITMGAIAILKEDFKITKRYDNTTKLTISDILIENRPDVEHGGSTLLYQIWKNGGVRITNDPTYGGTDVSSRYTVNVTLFFPLAGATETGIDIQREGIYNNPDISITVDEGDGIRISLSNMPASITQRILGANDFEAITPVDQDYSSLKRVEETEIQLAGGALADGDSAESVGIDIVSLIDGDDYGYGRHSVSFAQIGNGDDMSSVRDANYSIDIDALNEAFRGKVFVFINKAKLRPNISFVRKEYDASYDVEFTSASGYQLTTEKYSRDLAGELGLFEIVGDVTYRLSSNGKLNKNVMVDANKNVIAHNVMVSGLQIRVNGDEKLLRNYEIFGARYSDETEEYSSVSSVESGIIADYEWLDAVVVYRKEIEILTNNVVIKEKVYDGTRTADIDVSLEESGVMPGEDMDALFVDAHGTFARGVVNTNVPVTITGVVLQAKEGFDYLLENYVLKPYSERRTANIVARPVGVKEDEVKLGDKTYNGTTDISKNAVVINPEGIIESEQVGYGVLASGGAYFINKNVNVEKDADGNVVKVLDKNGVVYNPVLTNTRGQVNYSLAIATTEKKGENYIAFVDESKTLRYNEKYSGDGQVTYYYALPTTDKYILASNSAAYELAEKAGAIIGSYVYDNKNVYTVDGSKFSGEGVLTMSAPVSYINGKGKILQKSISILSDAIIENPNSTAFTKMYDGTRKFYGVRGSEIGNGDYYYDNAIGIRGLVQIGGVTDAVYVEDISAEFDDASTNANYVVFTIKKISGADADNYSIYGGLSSARKDGSIIKRTIDAKLKDGEMVYGTSLNTIVGEIEYEVHGNGDETYELTLWEGSLYLQYDKYIELMGSALGSYQESLRSRMFLANPTGGFDPIDEDDKLDGDMTNYYVRLSGISSLPTVNVEFSTSYPGAGEQSLRYVLKNVVVNNYTFNPVYSDIENGTSKLTVVKRELFVSTKGDTVNKNYAGSDPEVELEYYNENGAHGFAPSETVVTVFRINGVDYYPVVKWIVFNTKTLEWSYMEKYAVISDDLANGLVYLAHIEAPAVKNADGNLVPVNYDELIRNYNIHLGSDYVVNEDGSITLTYDGFEYTSKASKLMLVQPTMGGVSLRATSNNTYNETYSGRNLTASVLLGVKDGDEITIKDVNGKELEPVNADTYVGYINVKRPVRIDGNDPNPYFNTWTSADLVTIVIGKASPQLRVVTSSKRYDNVEFVYGVSGINNMISSQSGLIIRDSDVEITYEKQVGDGYEEARLIDAGIYRVTVQLNESFAANNPNYLAEKAVAKFTILRAEVNVTISTEGYKAGSSNGVLSLGAAYEEGKEYPISYRIDMTSDTPADIVLPKGQTSVVFEKEIKSSGRYPFNVVINEGGFDKNNYRLVNANGVLELTTSKVQNSTGSVTIADNEVIANRFVTKEISNGVGSGTDVDMWSKVNAYMPFIDKQAKLSSVVRLGLYYDNTLVDLDGESMTVSVAIPKSVGDLDGKAVYFVTRNGGLEKLENYTVTEDGNIEYTTDYLSALVFVDLTPDALELWQIIAISVGVGVAAIALLWTVIALIIRKSQLKKLI